RGRGYETPEAIVVRDGEPVGRALRELLVDTPEDERPRVIVTSGGTGLAPDDRTPEFTAELLERQSPGLIYAMWRTGLEPTASALVGGGRECVGRALRELRGATPEDGRPRVIVTSGGTGLAPDDRTPEFTAELLERQSPGLIYAMWRKGLEATASAVMSRGVAGVRGRTFVINFPGSKGGVTDGIAVIDELLEHIQTSVED